MDITTKSLLELKALAYDLLVQIQFIQSNLSVLNAEIDKKSKEAKEEVVAEPVAE